MSITELIIDMIGLNCHQAKTGSADVEGCMLARSLKPLEERIREKIAKIK